jgi:hypothetical protein
MPCVNSLQELALSNRVRLVWVPGHCGIHEEANALARAGSSSTFVGRSLVFRWQLRVSGRGSGSGYLNRTAPHGALRLRWSSVENVAEKAPSRLDKVLTEAA